MATVDCSHQGEGEVEDVAVEQRALLLQQHSQQLQGTDNSRISLTAEICHDNIQEFKRVEDKRISKK